MKLHLETVNDLLLSHLNSLMKMECVFPFRLVGGTALSLMIGHRMSVDIDLFTDSDYRSIDFTKIYKKLKRKFNYVSRETWINETIGNSCYLGNSKHEVIKLDMFYTDEFVFALNEINGIRISSIEEILAMKLDVIGRGGRKKDYWDTHALLDKYSLEEMLEIYEKRYPYNFSKSEIIEKLVDFDLANQDPDPICLKGKHWELIKLDIEELL